MVESIFLSKFKITLRKSIGYINFVASNNLQSIPQILNWFQVRRLTRLIESTNPFIFKPFFCKFCGMFGIIVVLKHKISIMS